MTYRTSRKQFEGIVEQAVSDLPEEFKKYFINITIIVEDFPTKEEAWGTETQCEELLGLFWGGGYRGKGGFFDIPSPLPDEIVLFQRNIENICSTEGELREEIRLTLVHEVGHYFGLSEADLKQYE